MRDLVENIKRLFLSREVFLNVFMCVVWGNILLNYVRGIIIRLPLLGDYVDEVQVMMIVVPMVLALPVIFTSLALVDYIVYLLWVSLYMVNYVFFPMNEISLDHYALQCIFLVFPYYFLGRIMDIKRFYTIFVWLSGMCIVMYVFYFMTYIQQTKSAAELGQLVSEDNMFAAYQLLPHVLMMFWSLMRKFHIVKLLISVLGVVALLSCGTRGPLACTGFFLIVQFFLTKFKHGVYIKSAVVVLGLSILLFLQDIAFALKELFEAQGLSTRVVDRILTGGIGHETGRDWIRYKLFEILDASGAFFGQGLFGSQRYGIIYAHSYPCDVFFSLGYVPGFLYLTAFCVLVGYAFIHRLGTIEQGFMLILISSAVMKLFLSSTFLFEPLYFMLIGMCINVLIRQRYKQTDIANAN